ncbi:MAG: NAD(P)/FAD-dependent oxidoreductase [Pseudomonadota bacterium]|nr:NAD(P)/FAD-dependent oxidoreductase [Pseudomonadota bacterium]
MSRIAVTYAVLIVGTGFGGLCTAAQLRRAGITEFVVLERAEALGGTWRDNRYPGCAVDVPSRLYSYSFAPNPDWSRLFAPREELWAYTLRCVDQFGLAQHIRLGEDVVDARWDATYAVWIVTTRRGSVYRASVLVSAMGALSDPVVPALPGAERFTGEQIHSARWPADLDLRAKRVAVVGTGASAIQFVPHIAPQVAQLTVHQRTAPWVVPRNDRPISAVERSLYRAAPWTQRVTRLATWATLEARAYAFTRAPSLLRVVEREGRAHLARQVADPALRARLTPTFSAGCKRILLSDDYYPTFNRPNVELVTSPIRSVGPASVTTEDGQERPVDVLIYGTGFDVTGQTRPRMFHGVGGIDLADVWERGASAYKGATVPGFPNLFLLLGPNTGLGHSSMLLMIEAQVAYIVDAVRQQRARGWRSVEVRPAALAAYNADLQRRLGRTVWASGCRSWYLDRHGVNTVLWPGFTFEFRRQTERFDVESYDVEPGLPPN